MFKVNTKSVKTPKKATVSIQKKVKHSDSPAKTNAKHGTVILRGKITDFDLPKAK